MENSKEKELIQQILSQNPQDELILIKAGVIAEHQDNPSLEDEEEILAAEEDAAYLESLSDEELEVLSSNFEEIFASLEREGCGDLAETLYEILYTSKV